MRFETRDRNQLRVLRPEDEVKVHTEWLIPGADLCSSGRATVATSSIRGKPPHPVELLACRVPVRISRVQSGGFDHRQRVLEFGLALGCHVRSHGWNRR